MAISSLSWGNLLALAIVSLILYTLSYAIYNLYFHPLARFPGPLLMRATKAGFCYPLIKGTLPFDVLGLHKKYGPVVRIAPDQLIFGDPQAWKDVMGHRVGGGPELEKSLKFYKPLEEIPVDIVNASREEHGQLRRTMAHGFSDRSMREQQPIIKGYIDLLIRRLRQNCGDGNKKLNINAWYNFTTFDIIGDLAFGESFGCLDNSDYHPWVRAIFQLARVGTVMQSAAQYPALMKLILTLIPKKAMQERKHHIDLTKAKLQRRMEVGKERPDLVEGLLRKKDELGLTLDKLQANSAILIIGGSETTATLLSGVTFLLLTNPDALAKLKSEIRSSFKSQHEIDFASVSALPYLLACLDEALRMYPPVPSGLPRVVPQGGASICGNFVPENTVVSIYHWAMYHNEEHFKNPFGYHPERWLNDPEFAGDHKDAFQPFHLGARNCIEMRLILTRILWNFDMRVADDSLDWMSKQRIYNLWKKGPLNVYLTPRQ